MSRFVGFSGTIPLIFGLLLAVTATVEASTENDVGALAAIVASPDSTWEERAAAEARLVKSPAELVLPRVVAMLRDHPDGPLYVEPENPEGDKDAPPAWLAYFAGRRVWKKCIADLPFTAEAASLAANLLPLAASGEARAMAAELVADHWSPRAEESLATWLRDSRQPARVRAAAAGTLYRHLRQQYEREIIGLADTGGPEMQLAVFRMLSDALPPWADPVVVHMGYRLLIKAEQAPDAAFDLARRIGAYVGQPFDPGPPEKETAVQRSLREIQTVQRALDWWKANGKQIQQNAAKLRPRDV